MGDILDNSMHSTTEQFFVFVIHGHHDEEFCTSRRVVLALPKCETGTLKIVGIAGCCRVAHVSEFALVAEGTHLKQFFGNLIVKDKIAVEESVVELVYGRYEREK